MACRVQTRFSDRIRTAGLTVKFRGVVSLLDGDLPPLAPEQAACLPVATAPYSANTPLLGLATPSPARS